MPKPARIALLILFAVAFQAAPAALPLRYYETDDLRLVYFDPTLSYLAPYAVQCFENSMAFQQKILGYTPTGKVTVLLSDFADAGNASAGAVPRNMLQFDVAPLPYTFESFVAPERMYMLMNHELVHVTTTDTDVGVDRGSRRAFQGKVRPVPEHPESLFYSYLTSPRTAAPRWYKEGIATFAETWMAGGIGRAQGSYDEMVFRSMVHDGTRFYDPLGLISEGVKTDFQLEANSYLYGTRFLSYLAYTRSPEAVVDWAMRTEKGDKRYFASRFREVFGIPMEDAWEEWVQWEHGFQGDNLETIREFPVTPYTDLSDRALGAVSRAHVDADANVLYAAFNYPGTVPHIGAISLHDGSIEKIIEVKRPAGYAVTSLAYDPEYRRLFYTTDNRALRDLRMLDPETGKARTLIKDARIGDLTFNKADGSLWGLRHLNGIVTIVRIPDPHIEWQQVRSWPYGEVLYDLDLSPDGTLIAASVAELSGRHALKIWRVEDLADEDLTPVAEVDFGTTIPMNFVFGPDGANLYGSTYYTGVANIFRYRLDGGEIEALTNAETGFFRPMPRDDGSMIVLRYTGKGFVPARIDDVRTLEDVNAIRFLGNLTVDAHPSLREWRVGSPSAIDLDDVVIDEGKYAPGDGFGLESLYPIVQGYKDYGAVGMAFNFSDYFSLVEGSASVSYTPDRALPSDERVHVDLDFRHRNWRGRAWLNHADFYDLFGPTKTSLKGYGVNGGYDRLLIWDDPRKLELNVDVAFSGDLDRLPFYQNVDLEINKLATAAVQLKYQNLRGSLGYVDFEKGHRWDVVAFANYVEGSTVPVVFANYDVGVPLPLHHSSFWFRMSGGHGFGPLDDPFANMFFGGFRNNWVDHGMVRKYREQRAFPGLGIDEVGGRTYGKLTLDWNLPPIRFERAGWQSFYLTWARTSVFIGGLVTDPDSPQVRQELSNVGFQMDFQLTLLFNLNLTFSVGYAAAFEPGFESRDQFMLSLNLFPAR